MLPFSNVFPSIWIVVFAAKTLPGERTSPVALAATNAATGMLVEVGMPKLLTVRRPPYPTGPQALLVTIDAPIVVGCHLALGWRLPERILDLTVEHRCSTNGEINAIGGLSGALVHYGLSASAGLVSCSSPQQMRLLLAATERLFAVAGPLIDGPRALLRGRYLCAVARIETTGVPVDQDFILRLKQRWRAIKSRILEIVDQDYQIHSNASLDVGALEAWLFRLGIRWPRLPSGLLDLSDDAFRDMARAYPVVRPLKELRTTLSVFDPSALTIGRDGRNRVPLRPFASRTGRNQPGAKASVLGTAAWLRQLILPKPGTGLALIDWSQQEFGIGAALSGDTAMQRAYRSGDPYLALAIVAGAAPQDATSVTHADVRTRYKAAALGLQYGMGAVTLARLTDLSEAEARDLQRRHKAAFPSFWEWSDAVETHAYLAGNLTSAFGWNIAVGVGANPRMLRNFPLQSNGAEMLRLACCHATEDGIRVCMPLHDALLIEAPLRELDDAVLRAQNHMAEASRIVLDGFELRSEVRAVRAPERWRDARGEVVWRALELALGEAESAPDVARRPPARQRHAT